MTKKQERETNTKVNKVAKLYYNFRKILINRRKMYSRTKKNIRKNNKLIFTLRQKTKNLSKEEKANFKHQNISTSGKFLI